MTQKNWDFLLPQFSIFFHGPWIRRIDWCKGHWCGANYIVVRLSDISSKTGKKCIFFVFLGHFWGYFRQPHNHIGWATSMLFSSINFANPRTNPGNFHEKILRIGELTISVFLSRPFWIFFFKKKQIFLASCRSKLVNIYRIARVFRNFDDYPCFQPQNTPA